MSDFVLHLPKDFHEYEWEVKAKGFFTEARLVAFGKQYRINFYDRVRLGQEIDSELNRGGIFFEPNLVVVAYVTISDMERAIDAMVRLGLISHLREEVKDV